MPFRHLLETGVFSPDEVTAMAQAYDTVRKKLHDRGQPALVNEIIAKRIIELAKLKALNAQELADRALASFGLSHD
ncbi:MAG: hypothetical protein QOF91_507 [Alphaproteobacteria bacterium]|jgi:hypothetical protein|nr:hypothetical protein [Alphaproteobacteria bacterium]MEA3025222.1 hypothetical protein [Alphaproteobacteria bacterium]